MTIAGYPDFQEYAHWLEPNLLAAYNQTLPLGHNKSGAQALTSYRAARVRVVPSANSGTVTLNWYSTAAEVTLIDTDSWNVNAGTGLSVIVPAKGPFCDLDINVTGAGAMTAETLLAGTNAGSGQLDYPPTQAYNAQVSTSIAISATTLFQLPMIRPGLGFVSAIALDATGKLSANVATVRSGGTVKDTLAYLGVLPNAAPLNAEVPLTDEICALVLINSDATAAHSFTGTITATIR